MAYNPLKEVKEETVIKEVKAVIELTGLAIQRINSGAFTIGSGTGRRFVRAVEHTDFLEIPCVLGVSIHVCVK